MIAICLSMIDVGDEDKFNRFYKRYLKLVIFILNDILNNSSEVEDVASECFIEFAKNFHRINDVECKETESYVKIVTRHKGFKAYNKRKKLPEMVDIDTVEEIDPVDYEELVIDKIKEEEMYRKILMNIPDRYYDIVYLSVVMGFTPKEIGDVLGMSVDSTYKKLKRAKTLIKDILDSRKEE